jgi:hypothetical protein
MPSRQGIRKNLVVRRQDGDGLPERKDLESLRPHAQNLIRRGTVLLGKHHVEGDGGDLGFGQFFHQVGQDDARPGPLAKTGEGLVIHIDDFHRKLWIIDPGLQFLVGVEDQPARLLDGRRIVNSGRDQEDQDEIR